MALTVEQVSVPLAADGNGVMRVGSTRVTLDTVVAAFREGATAEEIVQQYTSLQLADVYWVIGYFLHHQPEIDSYLANRQHRAALLKAQNEAQFDPVGIRDRLLARRAQQGL